MRQILPRLLFAAIFLLSSALPGNPPFQAAAPSEPGATRPPVVGGFAADRVIVKLHPSLATESVMAAGAATDRQAFENFVPGVQVRQAHALFSASPRTARVIDDPLEGIFLLELAPGSDVMQAVQGFSANAAVEWAEPDYLAYPTATTPNDPLFSLQWGLSQIDAPTAWDISTGAGTVPIALLDSGLQFNHPDLAGKLWINPGEVPGNGLDDDNNGFIDDVNGWDFVNADNLPADDNGHGTQTAGVAGAASNNSTGIAGVCWNCTLMPVKVMGAGGVANYSDIAAGVLYAARKGARVINISLGGYSESSALLAAIQSAVDTYGAVIVAGAGNDHLSTPFYPAAYPQVLAVAASGPGDILWGDSNYGEWVDVVAPGANIHTTFLGGDYGAVHGTSLSTAFVSGLAGLLRSHYPNWSAEMVRAQITHTAQNIDSLNPGFAGLLGSGRVNAYQAMSVPPQPLLQFHSQTVNGSTTARPEPGSSVDLVVNIFNDWADASSIQGALSSSSPYISITTASAAYGNIPAYATAANTPPFRFNISASAPFGASLSFNLRLTASGGYVVDIPINVQTASAVVYPPATITTQTWTNDRIYLINKNSGIPVGNTLTIEPGTEVRFEGDYTLTVQGTLIADGTPDQPIQINNNSGYGRIVFADSSVDAVYDPQGNYLSGSIVRNAIIDSIRMMTLNSASPYLSNNQFILLSEAIYAYNVEGLMLSHNILDGTWISLSGTGTILGNLIKGNHGFNGNGEGLTINSGAFEVRSNRIINALEGITIYNGSINLANNLILDNDNGVMFYSGDGIISNNTIFGNRYSGLTIYTNATPIIHNNNLIRKGSGYTIQFVIPSSSPFSIDATLNWWGTINPEEIDAAIYDGMDQFGLGLVNYEPFLTAPEADAPAYVTGVTISPDTTLGIQTATFAVNLNREMDQSIAPTVSFQSANQDTWETFTTSNSGLPDNSITCVATTPDGSIWFGTNGNGAAHYDGHNWTVYNSENSGLLSDHVLSIDIAPDGAGWFGFMNGVARIDGSTWMQFTQTSSGTPINTVIAISSAPDGSIWFGTSQGGALKYDGVKWNVFNTSNSGIASNNINAIAVSPNGAIWFGTDRGLSRFEGSNWTIYQRGPVSAITITPDGFVWAGMEWSGVNVFNGTNWIVHNPGVNGMPDGGITAIDSTVDGVVWVGDAIGMIARYNELFWENFYSPFHQLSGISINGLACDSNGSVWIGTKTLGAGVYFQFPLTPINTGSNQWLDSKTYRTTLDITSLIPRDDYLIHISGAVGTDGIEMAPTLGFPFTVDYAGAISDTTPPHEPIVELCAGKSAGSLSASWTAYDSQSSITLYSYAIGTTHGSSDVVDWTSTTTTYFSRTNLNLTAGQTYYVAVRARNAGGLWSEAGIPPGVLAGSGLCTINSRQLFLPMIRD